MFQIIQDFRHWPRAEAHSIVLECGHAKQVALGAIDRLQIRIVAHAFEAFPQIDDFVVVGHHDDGAESCAAFSGVGLN
jgi:hypothetical protein